MLEPFWILPKSSTSLNFLASFTIFSMTSYTAISISPLLMCWTQAGLEVCIVNTYEQLHRGNMELLVMTPYLLTQITAPTASMAWKLPESSVFSFPFIFLTKPTPVHLSTGTSTFSLSQMTLLGFEWYTPRSMLDHASYLSFISTLCSGLYTYYLCSATQIPSILWFVLIPPLMLSKDTT